MHRTTYSPCEPTSGYSADIRSCPVVGDVPIGERLRDGIKGSEYLDVATIFGVPQGDP
jgi:hypothetical protein